jgi:hypothetical protein
LPARKRERPRGVVDTSVPVAGIAGLKSLEIAPKNPSAQLLQDWIEADTFVWLVSEEILLEYKRVLGRLGVRRPLIGKVVNLLREEAERVPASALPNISRRTSPLIPQTIPSVPALKLVGQISS